VNRTPARASCASVAHGAIKPRAAHRSSEQRNIQVLSASGVIGGPTDAPMSSLSDPSPTDAGPIRLADAGRAHGSPCPFIFLARR